MFTHSQFTTTGIQSIRSNNKQYIIYSYHSCLPIKQTTSRTLGTLSDYLLAIKAKYTLSRWQLQLGTMYCPPWLSTKLLEQTRFSSTTTHNTCLSQVPHGTQCTHLPVPQSRKIWTIYRQTTSKLDCLQQWITGAVNSYKLRCLWHSLIDSCLCFWCLCHDYFPSSANVINFCVCVCVSFRHQRWHNNNNWCCSGCNKWLSASDASHHWHCGLLVSAKVQRWLLT